MIVFGILEYIFTIKLYTAHSIFVPQEKLSQNRI